MRIIFTILLFISASYTQGQNIDNSVYLCKYSLSSQKDSLNKNSVFNDIMYLEIGKENSKYYSYLFQLGRRNEEEDYGKSLEYIMSMVQKGRYYPENESEIIIQYYAVKKRKVMAKFKNIYCYTEDIETLNWKIHPETTTILQQSCQKATTFYRGRNYIAWFAPSIPYRLGPWEFTGLPGLILRISDTQGQFNFECTELLKQGKDASYKDYTNCKEAPKKKVKELRRLFATDMNSFDQIEWGVSATVQNADGTTSPYKQRIRPYNPIDLSSKY